MSRRSRFIYCALSLAVAFLVHPGRARAVSTSDRLLITEIASGSVLFDGSIDEPDPSVSSISFPENAPGGLNATAVLLTEPAGEPVDPTEPPPVVFPGTNIIVSDFVFFSFDENAPAATALVSLTSDGDPFLADLVAALALSPDVVAKFLEETGDLQDLTSLLGSDVVGWRVQVQSDVVPEPGTFALMGLGLVGLAASARRGRR